LGEKRFLEIFDGKLPEGYSEIVVDKRPMFVIGDPAALYREIRSRTGFRKILDFLPFEPDEQVKETA
jgi:hypothetical protein